MVGLRGLAIRNTIISGAGSTAIDFSDTGPGTIEYSAIEGILRKAYPTRTAPGVGN